VIHESDDGTVWQEGEVRVDRCSPADTLMVTGPGMRFFPSPSEAESLYRLLGRALGKTERPPKVPNTVKVRIAVCVDEQGHYGTGVDFDSCSLEFDDEAAATAARQDYETVADECGGGSSHVVFIEALVPLPKVETVSGSVVEPTREGQ
jgi:hypothetical protein